MEGGQTPHLLLLHELFRLNKWGNWGQTTVNPACFRNEMP